MQNNFNVKKLNMKNQLFQVVFKNKKKWHVVKHNLNYNKKIKKLNKKEIIYQN